MVNLFGTAKESTYFIPVCLIHMTVPENDVQK
jgi:hypothetical protein